MNMSVSCEYHTSLVVQDAVIRKDREFEDHLVDICIAVAAHTEDLFLHSIKELYDFRRRIPSGRAFLGP